jgi:hypothetical protein
MSCWAKGHGMSGVKRITVDADAWSQAQQAATRLRQVNRELPGMLDAVRRENQAAIDRAAAETRARQDALDRSLAGLSAQTKKIEAQTRQRIRAQEARLRGELRDTAGQLRQETRVALEDQERRFAEGLARERQERARETKELRDELTGIQKDRDRARSAAASYVADARVMRDAIARELPHERFAPGRLAELSRRLDNAEDNASRGLGEAALVQAQELYLQLSELRAEVELRDQEWQAFRLEADRAVTLLQQQIKLNTNPAVLDENGDQVDDYTLDVDFWSEGELSKLTEESGKLAARLADAGDPPSVAELREIAEHAAAGGELDERLTSIVTTAQARLIASQVRVNLAELVVSTLEETAGYSWEGQALYAGQDERRAFYSKLRHLDSSEIVVEVAPDDNGKSCTLRILSYETDLHDEEERVHRAHAIADTLRAHGLEAGLPAADMEQPDPDLVDFKKLGTPVTSTRPGQVRAATGAGLERA